MGLPSTIHRFQIQLADSDRGVYENLDLRLARHPSETVPFLLTRVLAYCLAFEPGIAFTGGLSEHDQPALWIKDLTGQTTAWIEVGLPAPDRLHRASKSIGRVLVFPHKPHELWKKQCEATRIHKAEAIRIVAFAPAFLSELEPKLERSPRIDLSIHDGHLFLTWGDSVADTRIEELHFSG
ncbi:MAG TPA: YaeQ family protein [Planctomycetota bacterium]|nr:YaeQ family protein [Planctomycetota bacterium]